MLDHNQLRTHAAQLAAVRDALDAALPLAISREAIEAIEALPEAERLSRQHAAFAMVHVAKAVASLHSAALAIDGPVEADLVI